ncbi:GIY-YIG nuclease family protein [Metallumcola ferriviriculae]|uniref:GIY-YIG nuclease family protein n=1 Tax=Metallumcola ferriviriculae TaxID=3039180 RepID=A0AAU0UTM0_9FIRM|nr:GIY-YIG nuclease family protein [Desulfitibacteraceae bacterium MK1]
MSNYFVYILKCSDNTYYVGITNNLDGRIDAHNRGKGAKYTRGRVPVELYYFEECSDRSEASKREYQLKKLTRLQKESLVYKAKKQETV